ncbi:MAG: single-stranded DNA-binding protein [Peptoclostridium sp.]|uniref:single-stranded DNA-binding protein n=1 Tax=Peptoclostridium sp. TaxID=1904860 RepID=UPI00139BEFFE|nr:single-stranded DNA-binding protein [Peptoclostridium sp.]MZQ74919.1 single-stranded DNA-binding protein [Peptoclostridium sp.]
MNSVVLIGRLTKDPDLSYLTSGKAVCKFDIAVNRTFKNQEGKYDADFFKIQAWDKTAEAAANNLIKGRLVAIEGELRNNNYEKDGVKHYGTVINATRVEFLEWGDKKSDGSQSAGQGKYTGLDPEGFEALDDDDFIPF